MRALRLRPFDDDKIVKLTVELPTSVHRDLLAYAEALKIERGGDELRPEKLVIPIIIQFMTSDRAFAKLRRARARTDPSSQQ